MMSGKGVKNMLELLAIILLVMWLGGFALHVGGGLIHLLLVAAVVFFALRFFRHSTAM